MTNQKARRGFQCWLVDGSSRTKLLNTFEPKFERVICHHVTYRYGVLSTDPLPPAAEIVVVGYASNDAIEALVVTVDGTEKRVDGKIYHITLSLDPEKAKPVDSNKLLSLGWTKLDSPIPVVTKPAFQ